MPTDPPSDLAALSPLLEPEDVWHPSAVSQSGVLPPQVLRESGPRPSDEFPHARFEAQAAAEAGRAQGDVMASTFVFSCPNCGDPFATTTEREVDIHSGANYTCDVCKKDVIFTALTPREYCKQAAEPAAETVTAGWALRPIDDDRAHPYFKPEHSYLHLTKEQALRGVSTEFWEAVYVERKLTVTVTLAQSPGAGETPRGERSDDR